MFDDDKPGCGPIVCLWVLLSALVGLAFWVGVIALIWAAAARLMEG